MRLKKKNVLPEYKGHYCFDDHKRDWKNSQYKQVEYKYHSSELYESLSYIRGIHSLLIFCYKFVRYREVHESTFVLWENNSSIYPHKRVYI